MKLKERWHQFIDGKTEGKETEFLPAILEVTETPPSPVGRAVIMVCMFCGRLGALAVVFLIGGQETAPSRIRFPKEDLVVG